MPNSVCVCCTVKEENLMRVLSVEELLDVSGGMVPRLCGGSPGRAPCQGEELASQSVLVSGYTLPQCSTAVKEIGMGV